MKEIWIYGIEAGSGRNAAVKIGFTNDVGRRFRDIQRLHPSELSLLFSAPGCPWSERALHLALQPFRIRGEWFGPLRDSLREFLAAYSESQRVRDDVLEFFRCKPRVRSRILEFLSVAHHDLHVVITRESIFAVIQDAKRWRPSKRQRLPILQARCRPGELALFSEAARLEGFTSLSEWALHHLRKQARRTMRSEACK